MRLFSRSVSSSESRTDRDRILTLAQLGFVTRTEVVHFLGPPGTGTAIWPSHSAWKPSKRTAASMRSCSGPSACVRSAGTSWLAISDGLLVGWPA
jgi:hypothetical protein